MPPFGDADNLAYAASVWEQMEGYRQWKLTTPVYKGASPHGAYLRMFSSYVTVGGVARPIVVKENFGGPDVTAETATAKPDEWLRAVTIMLQRDHHHHQGMQRDQGMQRGHHHDDHHV